MDINKFLLLVAIFFSICTKKNAASENMTVVGSPEETFEAISHSIEAFERLNNLEYPYFEVKEFQRATSVRCRIKDFEGECEDSDKERPRFLSFGLMTSTIFSASEIENYPDLQLYPALAVGVVPLYNIPELVGLDLENLDDDALVLSPEVLAEIFQSKITRWNDERILRLNTHIKDFIPDELIRVCVRKDSSGVTEIFKKYLSDSDPAFASSVGISTNSSWGGLQAEYKQGSRGILTYVTTQTYSISYYPYDVEMLHGSQIGRILRGTSNTSIEASQESIQLAVYVEGNQFAGDEDPSIAMANFFTSDLHSSMVESAWPIVGYSYFALHKDVFKENIGCDVYEHLLEFLDWFYNARSIQNLLEFLGFGFFPRMHVGEIEDHFEESLSCNGNLVEPSHHRALTMVGPFDFSGPFGWFKAVFNGEHGDSEIVDIHFNSTLGEGEGSGSSYQEFIAGKGDIIIAHRFGNGDNDQSNILELPYFVAQLAIIINLCADDSPQESCNSTIILDDDNLAGIFDGSITMWNDELLVQHNQFLSEYPFPINPVLNSMNYEATQIFVEHIVEEIPSFELDTSFATENNMYHVEAYVRGTPYSIGVTFYHPDVTTMSQVVIADFEDHNGVISHPSLDDMAECVKDGFEYGGHLLDFHHTEGLQDCAYPLASTYYLFAYETFDDAEHCDYEPYVIADYMDFLIKDDEHGALYHHGLLPLIPYVDNLYEYTQRRVDGMSCGGQSILLGEVISVMQDETLMKVVLSFVGISCIFSALALVWVLKHRAMRIIRFSQPLFLYIMLGGCIVYTMTLIPLTMDGSYFPPEVDEYGRETYDRLDDFCKTIPWLYTTGFTMIFGALLGKTWRIKEIFINPELKKKVIKNKKVLLQLGQGLLISWVICFSWAIDAPLHWVKVVDKVDPLNGVSPVVYHERCGSEKMEIYLPLILILQLVAYIYGTVLSYKIRALKDDFSETTSINLGMFMNMQALLFVIALGWIERDNPTVILLVNSFFIIIGGLGTVASIIIPKMWIVHFSMKVLADQRGTKKRSKDPLASHTSSSNNAIKKPAGSSVITSTISQTHDALESSGRSNYLNQLLPIKESEISPARAFIIQQGLKKHKSDYEGNVNNIISNKEEEMKELLKDVSPHASPKSFPTIATKKEELQDDSPPVTPMIFPLPRTKEDESLEVVDTSSPESSPAASPRVLPELRINKGLDLDCNETKEDFWRNRTLA